MSRPKLSVPKKLSRSGGRKRNRARTCTGLWVAIRSASSAISTIRANIARPVTNMRWLISRAKVLLRLRSGAAAAAARGGAAMSVIAHARVEEGVEHVDQQV